MKNVVLVLTSCVLCGRLAAWEPVLNDIAVIVVTAERRNEDISKIAASIDVITAEDIANSQAGSIADILKKYAGIQTRSASGNESLTSIDLRGFGGDNPYGKTLILLNGRRLNRPDMASINWLQIAPESVERIEIIRGSGSALYGDNAAGGVINIVTKRGQDLQQAAGTLSGGSFGENARGINFNGADDNSSCFVSLQTREKKGYRKRTAFSSDNAALSLSRSFAGELEASVDLSFNRTAFEMPGALSAAQTESDPRQAGNPDDDGRNEYINANVEIEKEFAGASLKTNLMYGSKDIASNMSSWLSFSDSKIKTLAFTPRYSRKQQILGRESVLLCGADYYSESVDLSLYNDRARTVAAGSAELTKDSAAFYVNGKTELGEKLIFSVGGRYEDSVIKAVSADSAGTLEYDESKKHELGAADISLLYRAGMTGKIFAKFSTLYRSPFTDEQAIYSGWGNKFITELEAERGKSADIGCEIYLSPGLKTSLALFSTDMKNEIAWNNSSSQNENLDRTRHRGLELSAAVNLSKRGKAYGNYSLKKAEFTGGAYNGKKLGLVPAHKALIGAEIMIAGGLTGLCEASYTGNAYKSGDYSNEASKLNSYSLLDVSLRHKKAESDLTIFAGVKNVLNEQYSTLAYYSSGSGTSSYYPSQGRSFRAGMSLSF